MDPKFKTHEKSILCTNIRIIIPNVGMLFTQKSELKNSIMYASNGNQVEEYRQ